MTIVTRIGRVEAVGRIESGCLFKYKDDYFLATDFKFKEHDRGCVNVETGEMKALPTGIVVEMFDNAKIDILGRG